MRPEFWSSAVIIACDTSSMVCSVAVVSEQQVHFQREISGAQVHIEQLTPFLQEALKYCAQSGHPAEGLALAIGPGSFNGLRIGLATMKGLALSLNLPLIPIHTTDGQAFTAGTKLTGLGRAVIFSHRNFVHYADYQLAPTPYVETPQFHYASWDMLIAPEIEHYFGMPERAFADWLKSEAGSPVYKKFTEIPASAEAIGLLAEARKIEGSPDADILEPFYNAQYEARKWTPPQF